MPEARGPILETRYGKLEGSREEGLYVFRGVPYAHAPVGPLRFRSPRAPVPWRRVRPATGFGPAAPQLPGGLLPVGPLAADAGGTSEDCLSLNVWTPGMERPVRPVLVWIHGGGHRSGTSASPLLDGARLARRGDVVVITLNYRLGALGFLAHPELRDEGEGADAMTGVRAAAGNWGLLDQLAALDWLADHVALLGGDPWNITLLGEGSGASCISILMGTPGAQGLFQKAIVQSGYPEVVPLDVAAEAAEALCLELGLSPLDFDELQKVPVASIVAAQARCRARRAVDPGAQRNGSPLAFPFGPALDGGLMRRHPLQEIGEGLSKGIPLLFGYSPHTGSFAQAGLDAAPSDQRELLARLAQEMPGENGAGTGLAELAVETYRRARSERGEPVEPADLWRAIQADRYMRVPALEFVDAHAGRDSATHAYLLAWQPPGWGVDADACHGIAAPFGFGPLPALAAPAVRSRRPGSGSAAHKLAARVQDAWIAFAHTADPSHADLPPWPIYDPKRRHTMLLDRRCRQQRAAADRELRFWRELRGA